MIDGDAGEKKQADDSRGNIIQNNTHQTRTRQVTSKPELLRNTEPGKLRELQTNSQTEGQRTAAVNLNLKHPMISKSKTTSRTNGAFRLRLHRDSEQEPYSHWKGPADSDAIMIAVSVRASGYCGRSQA